MKKSIILLVVACGVIASAIVYLNHKPAVAPAAAPIAANTPAPTTPASENNPAPEPARPVTPTVTTPAPVATAAAVPAADTPSNNTTNTLQKSVDALLTAKSAAQKHELFQELVKSGQIDAAIEELKQRAAANPTDAEIPTTLGEALLNKVRAMREAGNTDPTDLGIYALQADQQFNTALKIDPKNWEAQIVKASTIYYWPPDAQRDASAAQMLANVIDQQETMTPQPDFAQTYIALAKQYQKMGKTDEAAATVNLGLQKYPSDPTLQQMAAGH